MAKKMFQVLPFGIFVSFLITWFLSGKIIPIPHGTSKGGVIAAVGIFTIINVTFLFVYIFHRAKKWRDRNKVNV